MKIGLQILLLLLVASAVSAESNRLEILVFESGAPVENATVKSESKHLGVTDSDGYLEVDIQDLGASISFLMPNGSELVKEIKAFASGRHRLIVNVMKDGLVADDQKISDGENIQDSKASTSSLELLAGRVVSSETSKPIVGLRIFAQGFNADTVTDQNGRFKLEVPTNIEALTFVHRSFKTITLENIDFKRDLDVKMDPSGLKLEEFVVLAPKVRGSVAALIELRRNTNNVAEVIGSEQISKAGDSDVASSLKRVTGLTLVDGKFVYVRGLGERYSSILLNGFNLPSPDPYRRVVPLDMFPTAVLDSMVIQKSYSPDKPAEFGGGSIEIYTKSIPKKFFVKFSMGSNYRPDFTSFRTYQGGSTDWLGLDDGTRSVPSVLENAIGGDRELSEINQFNPSGFTVQELTDFSKSLNANYQTEEVDPGRPLDLKISSGGQLKLGPGRLGIMGSVLYKDDYDQVTQERAGFFSTGTELVQSESRFVEESERTINLAASLDLGYEWKMFGDLKQKFTFTNMLLRKTTDSVVLDSGENQEGEFVVDTTLDFVESQLLTHQFRSETDLKWIKGLSRVSFSKAQRLNPDQRFYRYEDVEGRLRFSTRNDGNQRLYSELQDQTLDYGMDLDIPINLIDDAPINLKFGWGRVEKERTNSARRFTFTERRVNGVAADLEGGIDQVLGLNARGSDGFLLVESTRNTDNYSASQVIYSQYLMFESNIANRLKVLVGARRENSVQDVETFDLHNKSNLPVRAELETIDILPVYSATYKLNRKGNMQLRASYSETLSRPDFRELSSSTYTDDIDGVEVKGNPDLVTAVIRNSDIRWEYYFGTDEVISFGGFYKFFEKPIEAIIEPGTEEARSFDNAKFARNYGIEFDTRFRLKPLSKKLKNFVVGINVARILSQIEIDEDSKTVQTSDVRPLQGQSPYVFNMNIEFDRKKWGTTASLLYNVYGSRITEVGTSGRPDIVEDPFYQLDFVFKKTFLKNYAIGFKAKNLLDPLAVSKQGSEITRKYRKGRAFSLNFSGSY